MTNDRTSRDHFKLSHTKWFCPVTMGFHAIPYRNWLWSEEEKSYFREAVSAAAMAEAERTPLLGPAPGPRRANSQREDIMGQVCLVQGLHGIVLSLCNK